MHRKDDTSEKMHNSAKILLMFIFFSPKVFLSSSTYLSVYLILAIFAQFWVLSLYIAFIFIKMSKIRKGKIILVKKCKIEQRSPRLSRSPKMTKRRSWRSWRSWQSWRSLLNFGFFGYIFSLFIKNVKNMWRILAIFAN